jgi:predicted ribosomally synthesized peptide with SipW-like signal peptide
MLKKLIGLAVAVLLLLGMTYSAAWAYFRDTETSTGNTITAGTLDLVSVVSGSYTGGPSGLYQVTAGSNGINGNVVFDVMAPDQYGTIKWVLTNTGSLAGTLTVSLNGTFTDGVTAKVPESLYDGSGGRPLNNASTYGDLGEYVMVTLQKGVGSSQSAAESALATGYINTITPNGNINSTAYALGGLRALWDENTTSMTASGGSSSYVVYLFSWYLTSAKLESTLYNNINIIQGDTAQLDLTFALSQ